MVSFVHVCELSNDPKKKQQRKKTTTTAADSWTIRINKLETIPFLSSEGLSRQLFLLREAVRMFCLRIELLLFDSKVNRQPKDTCNHQATENRQKFVFPRFILGLYSHCKLLFCLLCIIKCSMYMIFDIV